MLGLLPLYISHKQYSYRLRSQNYITLSVPSVCTELGKKVLPLIRGLIYNALRKIDVGRLLTWDKAKKIGPDIFRYFPIHKTLRTGEGSAYGTSYACFPL